jgi:GNAT superfamily N-acetyltransferase
MKGLITMFNDSLKKSAKRIRRSILKVLPKPKVPEISPEAIVIHPLTEAWIDRVVKTFGAWGKTHEQYRGYLAEQDRGERDILIASAGDTVVGYTTLVWASPHQPLAEKNIPELMDLKVFSAFQKHGIGSKLIAATEALAQARGRSVLGITVIETPDYAAARRLYPKLGYEQVATTPEENKLHLVKTLNIAARSALN